MAVTMVCPNLVCAEMMKVSEDMRGATVRCCRCHQPFQVPERARATETLFAKGRLLQDSSAAPLLRPSVTNMTIPPLNPIMSNVGEYVGGETGVRRRAIFEIWNEVQRRGTQQR